MVIFFLILLGYLIWRFIRPARFRISNFRYLQEVLRPDQLEHFQWLLNHGIDDPGTAYFRMVRVGGYYHMAMCFHRPNGRIVRRAFEYQNGRRVFYGPAI